MTLRLGAGTSLFHSLMAAALFVTFSVATAGCSGPVAAVSGDRLLPGVTYSADLDGDKTAETLTIDKKHGGLTIKDGKVVYHSRTKWTIVEACLGDTDHSGLLEVVTLVDDTDGRHVGLFAYFGGEYRERLVTSEITPKPLEIDIVHLNLSGKPGDKPADDVGGDFIFVTQEPPASQTQPLTSVWRWNGFSFTQVNP